MKFGQRGGTISDIEAVAPKAHLIATGPAECTLVLRDLSDSEFVRALERADDMRPVGVLFRRIFRADREVTDDLDKRINAARVHGAEVCRSYGHH